MKIVVILPTYNERGNIEKMIPLLEKEIFPKIKKFEMWLLVADDNSPDKTADVVRDFQKKWDNIELTTGSKEGLGAAYIRAMKYAMDKMHADAVVEFDSDFQHDPNDIPKLVKAYENGADYVIGSRYVPGGAIPKKWRIHRKFMSFFGSLFARLVLLQFGIHDMTSGFKLTSTEYLKKVDLNNLYSKYYAYKIHILYDVLKKGAKVVEVPIIFYEREKGSSKLSRKDLLDSFFVVIRLRLRDSRSFAKFLIVGGGGFMINAVMYEIFVRSTDFPIALSNIFAAQFAIFSNYNFNNLWTFKHERSNTIFSYFGKMAQFFTTSNIGVIFIQSGVIQIGDVLFGEELYRVYFLIGTGFLVIWNFSMYRFVIWKKKH